MENCYVFACGPSIKNQDLSLLRNKPCVTISNFFVHPEFENLDILCHIFGPVHYPITEEMIKAWFLEAEQKFKIGQNVMINPTTRYIIEKYNLFSKQNIIYYNGGDQFPVGFPNVVGPYASISGIAVQYGIYTKAKNVYMIGFDHSWINHPMESKHFYEESESVLFRMGYNEWFGVHNIEQSIELERRNLEALNENYKYYREIANNMEINLYNSTPGSLVNTIEFKYFDEKI